MVMLKTQTSAPIWVPDGYKKLGWHAGFDVLVVQCITKKKSLENTNLSLKY